MRNAIKHALVGCLATLAAALAAAPAQAGRPCEPAPLSASALVGGLELAGSVREALEREKVSVAVIARAGQDLSRWGQEFSHIGIAYREPGPRGSWRVLHKLNQCGTDTANLYRQGLAEFFTDGLHEFEAAIVPMNAQTAAALLPVMLDRKQLSAMHERAYSMLAHPRSTRYQQSNQWVMETIANVGRPDSRDRRRAQLLLDIAGYRGDTVRIGTFERLGARLTRANVAFDDHPNRDRYAGRITTTTADSALRFLASNQRTQPMLVR